MKDRITIGCFNFRQTHTRASAHPPPAFSFRQAIRAWTELKLTRDKEGGDKVGEKTSTSSRRRRSSKDRSSRSRSPHSVCFVFFSIIVCGKMIPCHQIALPLSGTVFLLPHPHSSILVPSPSFLRKGFEAEAAPPVAVARGRS